MIVLWQSEYSSHDDRPKECMKSSSLSLNSERNEFSSRVYDIDTNNPFPIRNFHLSPTLFFYSVAYYPAYNLSSKETSHRPTCNSAGLYSVFIQFINAYCFLK